MRHRVTRPVVEKPGVAAASLDPAAERLDPIAVDRVRPADEHVCEAPLGQMLGGPLHDRTAELVRGQAAVAVGVRGVGRDHVRRVRDDEVETLTLDRRETGARSELDRMEAVQGGVERRKRERARVHVCRDHALAVLGGKQRLDSAAGSEVQGARAGSPDGQLGEGHRRRLDPGNVVEGNVGPALGARVGGDVVVAVRNQPDERPHPSVPSHDEPERGQLLGPQRCDRSLDSVELYVVAEQEEPRQRREIVGPVDSAQVDGRVDRAGRELVRAEPLLDPLGRVAGPLERDAQAGERRPVAAVGHVSGHGGISTSREERASRRRRSRPGFSRPWR